MTTYINGNQYSGGISTFIELTDAPSAYGFPSQVVRMNSAGDALEFASGTGNVATDTIWNAAGDLVVGTGNDTATILPIGLPLQQLRANAAGNALEFATIAGFDIAGLTAETSIADDDLVAIYDTSASANRKMTKANFVTGLAPAIHNLVDTTNHPVTGLTTGHVLQALSATTYGFAAPTGGGGGSSFVKQWSIDGVVFETTFLHWVVPEAGTFATVIMSLESAPSATGTYCKVQVMKNGLLETDSVFASDIPMQITEVTSATNGVYQASGTLDGTVTVAAGDVIWCRVNQADAGSAGLLVQLKVTFT